MDNLYLDIHILQTVPPNCINRDDTGAPKMAFMVASIAPAYLLRPGNALFV